MDSVIRNILERLIAAAGLIFLSPVLLVTALIVMLDSPGNPFYAARRIGKDGKPFRMWKFRTMRPNSDRLGPAITARNDPRLIRSGAFLRKSKLDELPQLVNVVTGQMSLIGPRPEAPQIVALYSTRQRDVLAVKPGITGIVQVSSGEESDRIPVGANAQAYYLQNILNEKLEADLQYLRARTIESDLKLLLATARLLARSVVRIF
jgi:lipopolysaccharide/colanic/teichoic acid biosynthesis glycosyltransferase